VVVTGVGLTAASYAAWAGAAWCRYGRLAPRRDGEAPDTLLDQFMPAYEVAERHHIRIAAPAAVVFRASTEMYLDRLPIVHAIFKTREWIMRSRTARPPEGHGFLAQMRAIGWGTLADVPGREVVTGAVMQPWKADVVFRPLPPEQFAAFQEPGYVKIAWTLRADPTSAGTSVFRTETRAMTTDAIARAKFRRYWALASPGIILIRRASLRPLKKEAERRMRLSPRQPDDVVDSPTR
jgi:hypothetical protein